MKKATWAALAALAMLVASTVPASAGTILDKKRTVNSSGMTITMFYEQEVLSGADKIRPHTFVVCGLEPGNVAFPYLYTQTENYYWLPSIEASTYATGTPTESCFKWAVDPSSWVLLGQQPDGQIRTYLHIGTDQGPQLGWPMYESSGSNDPGGRPTLPNMATDFVRFDL